MNKKSLIYLLKGNAQKALGIVVLFLLPLLSMAQLSPGDLTEPHSHLEGLSNCTECHDLGKKVSSEKCLKCHTSLNERIKANKGYHVSSEVKGKECIKCHSDHHGKKFEIIRFDKDNFNHQLTGYTLEGAHKNKKCVDCHKKDFISDSEIKKKEYTFLGLNDKCLTCHEDEHQNTLSSDCISCHTFEKFKPASKFDHKKSRFILKGKHQEVDCSKCHTKVQKAGKEFTQFKGIKFQNCTSCHKDIHNNKFGNDCAKCHNENSFHQIAGLSGFNHSKTNFPLTGKHINLDCKKCHTSKLTDPIKHNLCLDCHKDYHEGQFIKNNVRTDCKECHTTKTFIGSSYTIELHNKTKFKLEGAHMATPCFVCHKKTDKWDFRIKGDKCTDCHDNTHKNHISEKYYPEENCTACHTNTHWSQVNFDHNTTKFKLLGAHKKTSCTDCHFKKDENGITTQKFKTLKTTCVECHTDKHAGQFNEKGNTDCLRCHNNNDWKIDNFDHNKTKFPLDGKHKNVACAKCHKPKTIGQTRVIEYKLKSYKCESCH